MYGIVFYLNQIKDKIQHIHNDQKNVLPVTNEETGFLDDFLRRTIKSFGLSFFLPSNKHHVKGLIKIPKIKEMLQTKIQRKKKLEGICCACYTIKIVPDIHGPSSTF